MRPLNLMGCGFVLCSVVAVTSAGAARWPGFRGPVSNELSASQLPLEWSPEEQIAWKADLPGYGQSSPVIWDDHVYVTSIEGPNKEQCHVLALDLQSGEKLWQGTIQNASPYENSNYVSKAAPTAIADANGVIVLFEGGNLLALKHDGRKRWEKNLVTEYGPVAARHGLGSSLLQTDETVVVWIERSEEPYILALDKQSGDVRWKVPGLGVTSWSTPIQLEVDGDTHLVFSGSGIVRGISPDDGTTLWTLEGVSGNATPSPWAVGNGQFLLGATVARGESGEGRPADSNGLVQVTAQADGKFTADFVWRAKRATCSFGSPIAHRGYAYFVNRSGVLFCLDLKTGEEVYAERTPESVWATPLAVGNRIYLVGSKGTTTVIQAGDQFKILAENRLWDEEPKTDSDAGSQPEMPGTGTIQYSVAAVPGQLLIRTGSEVYGISAAAE